MQDDLRHFRSADSFALFTPDEAGAICAWLLFIAWLADRMGWLA